MRAAYRKVELPLEAMTLGAENERAAAVVLNDGVWHCTCS
jgi:hypothetical protein